MNGYGYGPLPGIGARDPEPVDDAPPYGSWDSYPTYEEDEPVCEWCSEVVPDGASVCAPYCSEACRFEAATSDALADATHQAAKDRANEPDRWPSGRRGCPACGQPLLPGEERCPACPFVLPYYPRGNY